MFLSLLLLCCPRKIFLWHQLWRKIVSQLWVLFTQSKTE
jgi:hypothetical protein